MDVRVRAKGLNFFLTSTPGLFKERPPDESFEVEMVVHRIDIIGSNTIEILHWNIPPIINKYIFD